MIAVNCRAMQRHTEARHHRLESHSQPLLYSLMKAEHKKSKQIFKNWQGYRTYIPLLTFFLAPFCGQDWGQRFQMDSLVVITLHGCELRAEVLKLVRDKPAETSL